MSTITDTRKCGRCMALENVLGEFELSEMEVEVLKRGGSVSITMDSSVYERMRALLEK